jgi:hypothetical protein
MHKILFTLILGMIIGGASAVSVQAAVISFTTEGDDTVGTGSVFAVDVKMNSTVPINALSLVIPLPSTVELVGNSDANSLINLWVEKPKLNNKREVVLSGLIPGGFTGEGAQIVRLHFRSAIPGSLNLAVSADSRAYIHSETGTADPVTSRAMTITMVDGRINNGTTVDSVPPEEFVPVYVQVGDGESAIWAVGFAAQDKGSGVKEYFVAESKKSISVDKPQKLNGLVWKSGDSPTPLNDQSLKSYVYVKAVDMAGNERVARLTPDLKWYEGRIGYILIAVLLIGVLYAIFSRKNTSSHKR